jgi:oligopeptide transport system substrate-binding protein
VLRVALSPAPASLESTNAVDPSGREVIRMMCDPLFNLDPVTGKLKPAIGLSVQVLDSGKRFIVTLRKGVRYSDGREVRAQDLAFTLSRIASADYASNLASAVAPILGYPTLHDPVAVDSKGGSKLDDLLLGAHVLDNYSLEIEMYSKLHEGDFLRVLTDLMSTPIPKREVALDETAFAHRPVCAGPYRMTKPFLPGDTTIRLERTPHYAPRNSAFTNGGRGYPDAVEFHIYGTQAEEYAAFRAGEVDVAHVPRAKLADARSHPAELVQVPGSRLDYIGLPVTTGVLKNVDLRRALSQAIDREALAKGPYGGARVPAGSLFPPTLVPLYRPDACGDLAPAGGDVRAARASLAKSGLAPKSVRIRLAFNDEFGNRAVMAAVADQWRRALGISVDLRPTSWDSLLSTATHPPGFTTAYRMSYQPLYVSGDRVLTDLFDSRGLGVTSYTGFQSQAFDDDLARARRVDDDRERQSDLQRLEKTACATSSVVPLEFGLTSIVITPDRVQSARGPLTDATTGEALLRELFVAS